MKGQGQEVSRFDDTFALEGNEEDCHVTNKQRHQRQRKL